MSSPSVVALLDCCRHDGRFDVKHAAVAYLVFVEGLVELLLPWKMFFYQVQKESPDVRGYGLI